jgi:CheY-like chemotaxis protein
VDFIENAQLYEELLEADRRKDEFLATLAHELRNPLAPIRNAVQLLRAEPSPRKELQLARDIIDRQLNQMVRLVDDLLDVSRITRGKLQLRTERIALADAVNSAIETSRPLIELAGHELTVSLPAEPILLEADLTRLAQVFSNLLNNAAKYTDRGGQIRLSAWREGSDVVVSVADTGIGVSAEQLPRIFEMFSQVTPALERTQGGLGIGLSLVRGLIEMHGGSIEARSDGVGRGSDFRVRLPVLLEIPAGLSERCGAEATPAGVQCRVLVVDDNQDAAKSLALMLRALGHTCETAFDGAEALQVAERFRPEVALLDIGMPKFNGYEVARRLRAEPWGRGLMLIALTGWGQEEDKRLAREAGFDHHLTKPATMDELQRLIVSSAAVSVAR